MADLIKKIKIKKQDGTYTDYIPIGVDAVNAITDDGESVQLKLNKKPYCFDTVVDMKADTKLRAGDVCQVLGYYEKNDGITELYKIIDNDFSESVDDYNHIELQKDKLYAIRIEQKRDKDIKMLQHEKKGMWGVSRNVVDNVHYLIYSDDGIHWNYVGEPINDLIDDASAVCEINGIFYYTGNGFYQYSKDLTHWSVRQRVIENPNYNRTWGTVLFVDKNNNNKIYAYTSFQYSNETIITPSGGTSYRFKIVYQEVTQNINGSLTFSEAHDLYYVNNKSYMDSYVIYDKVWGYLMALKDEEASTISIYEMNSPTSVGNLKCTIKGVGIEAPQLITDGQGNVFCYVQNYKLYPQTISGVATLPDTQGVIRLSTKETFIASAVTLQDMIFAPLPFRHMGVTLCSDKAYYLLKQIGISCVPGIQQKYINWEGKKELREITTNGTYTVVNHPHVIYQIGSNIPSQKVNVTLNLKSVFKNEPFKLLLNNCEITWTGDIPSWWTYSQHFINNDTIFNYKELPLLQGGITRPILNI